MHPSKDHQKTWNREHIRRHLQELFGAQDTSGIELLSMIRFLAHLSETIEGDQASEGEPTGPRLRLLLRLLGDERAGNLDGLTPTALSHAQQVNKNTISSLLRGLEEQGLIQRNLDAKDYRVFRIQLTSAGRELIRSTAPQRMERLNQMAAGLSAEEREQVMALLDRLRQSMMDQTCTPPSRIGKGEGG